MPELTKLDHFAVSVKDLDHSVKWYEDVLGLRRLSDPGWGPEPVFLLSSNDSGVAIFSSEQGSPLKPDAGLPHFAFATDKINYEHFKDHLNSMEIQWTEQDHIISTSIYFRDPDNYKLEITTYDIQNGN